jgi:hypothetical protein
MTSESKPPVDIAKVFRKIAADKAEAREAAAVAMAKAPDTTLVVVRQDERPPRDKEIVGTSIVDIEATGDGGTVTLLSGYEAGAFDVLPAVLAFARARAVVVEYRNRGELRHRFDPELPLMYRASQPLDDALATLSRSGLRMSRDGEAITIEEDRRHDARLAWVLTIVFFPFALVLWGALLVQSGFAELREYLADTYVSRVLYTRRVVVGPGRLVLGDTPVECGQLLAIACFVGVRGATVSLVTRDGVISMHADATFARQARRLAIEQTALADVLAHFLSDASEAPYR